MKTRLFTIIPVLLSGFLFLAPVNVFAGAESGFYLGGGFGNATVVAKNVDPANPGYKFDESDSGYKLFGGFNFGIIPLVDVAVEGSYVDFGKPSGILTSGAPVSYDVSGYDLFGLVGLNFGPFGMFAKYGMINWDAKSTLVNQSGTDQAYGVGLKFQVSSFAFRVEYEVFDVSGISDLDMASASLVYTF